MMSLYARKVVVIVVTMAVSASTYADEKDDLTFTDRLAAALRQLYAAGAIKRDALEHLAKSDEPFNPVGAKTVDRLAPSLAVQRDMVDTWIQRAPEFGGINMRVLRGHIRQWIAESDAGEQHHQNTTANTVGVDRPFRWLPIEPGQVNINAHPKNPIVSLYQQPYYKHDEPGCAIADTPLTEAQFIRLMGFSPFPTKPEDADKFGDNKLDLMEGALFLGIPNVRVNNPCRWVQISSFRSPHDPPVAPRFPAYPPKFDVLSLLQAANHAHDDPDTFIDIPDMATYEYLLAMGLTKAMDADQFVFSPYNEQWVKMTLSNFGYFGYASKSNFDFVDVAQRRPFSIGEQHIYDLVGLGLEVAYIRPEARDSRNSPLRPIKYYRSTNEVSTHLSRQFQDMTEDEFRNRIVSELVRKHATLESYNESCGPAGQLIRFIRRQKILNGKPQKRHYEEFNRVYDINPPTATVHSP